MKERIKEALMENADRLEDAGGVYELVSEVEAILEEAGIIKAEVTEGDDEVIIIVDGEEVRIPVVVTYSIIPENIE
jgi:hypothetical protein